MDSVINKYVSPPSQRRVAEFEFSDTHFRRIQRLAYHIAGIKLSDAKRSMVYGRIARRLRSLKVKTFDDYLSVLSGEPDESELFINAITTNLTSFFRERHHFEFLEKFVLQNAQTFSQKKTLRIWSAGCSTGEEPYSIALTLARIGEKAPGLRFRILATDIDSSVLASAQAGSYPSESVENIDKYSRLRWFAHQGNQYVVSDELKSTITFHHLNLLNDWPIRGTVDLIFCRNVIIYFDKKTQERLVCRFANMLNPGGILMLGHSETILSNNTPFKLIGRTIYQKQL